MNECGGQQTCHYPSHSVPSCSSGSPCFFSCKDGYTASPSGKYPTACICEKPYIECNGKCGSYKACPSPHAKRDLHAGGRLQVCPQGMSACGILGRSAKSWECVDTHSDLESCKARFSYTRGSSLIILLSIRWWMLAPAACQCHRARGHRLYRHSGCVRRFVHQGILRCSPLHAWLRR